MLDERKEEIDSGYLFPKQYLKNRDITILHMMQSNEYVEYSCL